jgi:hypothetical protein
MSTHVRHFDAYHNTFLLVKTSKCTHMGACDIDFVLTALYRQTTWAPSILRANCFGRWVVTHSLADDNFHVHRPAVFSNQHLSWYRWCVVYLGALTMRSVHPAAPVLLTKTWPTGRIQSYVPSRERRLKVNINQVCWLTYPFKVWE